MRTVDISGEWSYILDPDCTGEREGYYNGFAPEGTFRLPGSTCENMIGEKQEYYGELSREAVRAPRERYSFVGALWLTREVDVPDCGNGVVRLFLERVNIASDLWVDGKRAGRQIIELSAPHIYDLSGLLTPGRHTLTLRIDNRNLLNFGDMASGYSVDTQGIWCGAVGRIELQFEDVFHIDRIDVYPDAGGRAKVTLTLACGVASPWGRLGADVSLTVTDPDGGVAAETQIHTTLYNARQVETAEIHIENAREWDEFTPSLYTLTVRAVSADGIADEKRVRFGMRTVAVRDGKLTLNGRPLSLRGTIDCAQFPLTGYPSFEIGEWRRRFGAVKKYGLNHVRFHAWCPPECAFRAADEAGVYLLVEMPLWVNRDIASVGYGDDPIHDIYYPHEARVISKTYGNHPSFLMFSNGNETCGDFGLLSDITRMMRAYDPRRLYTLTSNFDHPVMDCEDYVSASEVNGINVRLQNIQDKAATSTDLDYSEAVRSSRVPIVTFEVGQYCAFPDVDICEEYTGNMLPVNFDAIRKRMKDKNVYGRLREYVAASGKFAAKLYREDIEAALRTHGLGGFELLSLSDYTGQSTATVGMLDAFFRDKGFIAPEEFRRFCAPVVPLLRARRIFSSSETFEATLDLYDFGKEPTADPEFRVTVYTGGAKIYETRTKERKIAFPLREVTDAASLTVTVGVSVGGKVYENSRDIFVFPEKTGCADFRTVRTRDELDEIIAHGGAAVVLPELMKNASDGSFIPVFWSPMHFPTNRPSGWIIDENHPVFAGFPTDRIPDYQWKTLLDGSKAADISALPGIRPIVEAVPNFVDCTPRSPFFELRVGGAKLLFCGFGLDADDLPVRTLRKCIAEYVSSPRFEPRYEADTSAVASVLG